MLQLAAYNHAAPAPALAPMAPPVRRWVPSPTKRTLAAALANWGATAGQPQPQPQPAQTQAQAQAPTATVAAQATTLRGKAPAVCGCPVAAVLRYWGYMGATPAQARAALVRLGHPSAYLSTVHCQVAAGAAIRRGQQPKHPGKVMVPSPTLAAALAATLAGQ